jgi:mannose-6-phosphate isomerase-like protein (cupin superfamily)
MSRTRIIRPGEGEALWGLGEKFIYKLGPRDTDGAFSVIEMIAQPRNGPPPHLHHREDEMFVVIEGEFAFSTRDTTLRCTRGDAVYLPKDSLHT